MSNIDVKIWQRAKCKNKHLKSFSNLSHCCLYKCEWGTLPYNTLWDHIEERFYSNVNAKFHCKQIFAFITYNVHKIKYIKKLSWLYSLAAVASCCTCTIWFVDIISNYIFRNKTSWIVNIANMNFTLLRNASSKATWGTYGLTKRELEKYT